MMSLVTIMCLRTALVGVHVDYQLDAREQTRGGYIHVPGAPPGSDFKSLDFIVTPGAQITLRAPTMRLMLRYSPQLLKRLPMANGFAPLVLHRANLTFELGQ